MITLISTTVFVLAFTVTTMLHELAHALAALAQGDRPVLYHTFVSHQLMPASRRAITAAAGPFFSLAQGVAISSTVTCWGASAPMQLFLVWMGLHGLVNFFGYMISTPFAPAADFGKISNYLRLGRAAKLCVFGTGIVANFAIGLIARRLFLELAPMPDMVLTGQGRMEHIARIAVAPWIIGSLIVVFTRLPSPQRISLIYPLLSGIFTLVAWACAASAATGTVCPGVWLEFSYWPWALATVIVLGFFRFVLARGIRLGSIHPV